MLVLGIPDIVVVKNVCPLDKKIRWVVMSKKTHTFYGVNSIHTWKDRINISMAFSVGYDYGYTWVAGDWTELISF